MSWSRKRDLPNVCPRGHTAYQAPDKPTLDELLKSIYSGPQAIQVYDPFWRMMKWESMCATCIMFSTPAEDWDLRPKTNSQLGN